MDEQVLAGGNMNAVVRVGDTVLRQPGPWTPTIHRLLDHLHSRGVTEAPRALGRADDGREVLEFLPGDVPVYPMPDWVWQEHVLRNAARLLRRLHDATLDFDRAGAVWQLPSHSPSEVICHNDFSPHNLVFQGGQLTGVIDFDTCSPGPRVHDLAYLATRLVPLTADPPAAVPTWAAALDRLRALLDAYGGGPSIAETLQAAHGRLLELADFSDGKAEELRKPAPHEHAAFYRADAAWLRERIALHDQISDS